MTPTGSLTITAPTDREIRMARDFNAPRHLVWEAITQPALLKRWLTGPPGWSLDVCEIDLKVGGAYRYVWRHTSGKEMGMGGVYQGIAAPERLVQTEKFDESWYPGSALVTTVLIDKDGRTTLEQTLRYESKEARDGVLKSPMADGVNYSYDRLAELLATQTT